MVVPERKAPIFKYNTVFKITFIMQVKKPSVVSYQSSVKTKIFQSLNPYKQDKYLNKLLPAEQMQKIIYKVLKTES